MPSKVKSKKFRVVVEGDTVDGREVSRQWIEEMSATYNPEVYGARINVEHIVGLNPNGDFNAQGDILSCSMDEIDRDGVKLAALYAELLPNEEGLTLNKKGKKVYPSVEIDPSFSSTGKAYLVGLAFCDRPASLNTEMVKFSASQGENSPLTHRKIRPENYFSATVEENSFLFEFEEIKESASSLANLSEKFTSLFSKNKKHQDQNNEEISKALSVVADEVVSLSENIEKQDQTKEIEKLTADLEASNNKLEALTSDMDALKKELDETELFSQRPAASGGEDDVQSDF